MYLPTRCHSEGRGADLMQWDLVVFLILSYIAGSGTPEDHYIALVALPEVAINLYIR